MQVTRADGSVIAYEVVGEPDAAPVLFCHGLADSRLSTRVFTQVARELGLCVVAPDRPGTGRTDPRRLRRLADWAEDAALVLDAVRADSAAVVGVSGGGPFAAACAARMPGRVRSLVLVSPLGSPGWPTRGMAAGERLSLEIARRAPHSGAELLGRLAALERRSPQLFLRLATSEMPDVDRRALQQPGVRDPFLANYVEAFRRGSWGVAQDLRVLTRPWGFEGWVPSGFRPRSITGTRIPRSRPSTPGCTPGRYRARSFSSTPARVTSRSSVPTGRCWPRLPGSGWAA